MVAYPLSLPAQKRPHPEFPPYPAPIDPLTQRPTAPFPEPRASALESAKLLLKSSEGKDWQQLAREKENSQGEIYCERLTEAELEKSTNKNTMGYIGNYRCNRSRSVDLSFVQNEKYLSRWSRENTPIDCQEQYERRVRRSYTPVREVGAVERVDDNRKVHGSSYRSRTPLAMVTAPYHTNVHYRSEQEPFRKYDVFQLRTWSYPIYKYIYGRDSDRDYRRPYSFTRTYGTTTSYTPPQLTAESRPITTRRGKSEADLAELEKMEKLAISEKERPSRERKDDTTDGGEGYSGYSYLANETNYDIASQPKSLKNYFYTKSYLGTTSAPWYWSYYGNSGLRHFNSYRPKPFTSSNPYWKPYY